jgi:DNA-binding PadR family transcriptional regulator
MSEADELPKNESLFIEQKPVNWEDISAQQRSDLDFVPDVLTDAEIQVINVLVSSGALSAREIWNKISKLIYKSNKNEKSVDISYEELRDRLKDDEISHPSYHTVKKSLDTLVENGVVSTRPSNKGNTDRLYTINPKFKKQWRTRRNKIKSNNIWLSMSDRTLDFYKIIRDKESRNEPYNY